MAIADSLNELLRRADITSRARYNASRRLESLGWTSQWTLALLAIGQIVISLISVLKLPMMFSQTYVDFMGLFFGVLVLAYSLLLGMANFNARSTKLHHCGMELGGLARDLHLTSTLPNASSQQYDAMVDKYYRILEKYENHTAIDYLKAHHEYYSAAIKKDPNNKSIPTKRELRVAELKIFLLWLWGISHYVISIGVMFIWIIFLIKW